MTQPMVPFILEQIQNMFHKFQKCPQPQHHSLSDVEWIGNDGCSREAEFTSPALSNPSAKAASVNPPLFTIADSDADHVSRGKSSIDQQ